MTRDEAIKFANCLKNNYTIDFNDMADFCEMAIEALKTQPKTEGARGDIPLQQSVPKMPQPSDDCISRKAVMDIDFNRIYATCAKPNEMIRRKIVELPPVTPQSKEESQQKKGRWAHDGSNWANRWICSECGYKLYDEQSRFCPDCGVRMEAKE